MISASAVSGCEVMSEMGVMAGGGGGEGEGREGRERGGVAASTVVFLMNHNSPYVLFTNTFSSRLYRVV